MIEDPFEGSDVPSGLDDWAVLASRLKRSMTWDLVGLEVIKNQSELLGDCPASPEVIDAEHKDMIARKMALMPVRNALSFHSYIAAEAASHALLKLDRKYETMSDEDKATFRIHNLNVGSAVADVVISHMIQSGLLHYGEHP